MRRFVLFLTIAGAAFAQCEISPGVRDLLAKPEFRRRIVETAEQKAARTAAFEKALADHPGDYFILRAKLRSFEDPAEARKWAADQLAQHPDALVYQALDAESLFGKDTMEAVRRLEALEKAHPTEPRPYLQIASGIEFGRFRDKARIQKELESYRKLCPDSTDNGFLSLVTQFGSPQQIAPVAADLRKHLESATGDVQRNRWEDLWSLEFKAHPLAEHAAVRKKIAEDLARFEQSPKRQEVAWMTFLRSGYQSVGDTAAADRLAAEIVAQHPKTAEARRIAQERANKERPYPRNGSEEDLTKWRRADLPAKQKLLANAPEDPSLLLDVVFDLGDLPETKPDDYTAAVDRFLAAYRKNPEFTTRPPFDYRIAETYMKMNVRLDQVPAMVESAYRAMLARDSRDADDRYDDASLKDNRRSFDSLHMESARILLECYRLTHNPAAARAALERTNQVVEERETTWKSRILALKAKLAEIENHKPDAVVLYRAAVNARTGPQPAGKDALAADLQRLWNEMGGTPDGYALLMEKPKIAEAAKDTRWEKPQNPLPAFSLTDLQGKTWKLASLGGKTLLINIWATWCGPCIAEHPEFQKLYDKLKDRTDVSVLTFNVDDDLGKVAPYMAEHKYTFPVLPAADVVDAVVPVLAIPRNWFVTPKGKLEVEQVGFGVDPDWEKGMLAKLDEVAKLK